MDLVFFSSWNDTNSILAQLYKMVQFSRCTYPELGHIPEIIENLITNLNSKWSFWMVVLVAMSTGVPRLRIELIIKLQLHRISKPAVHF